MTIDRNQSVNTYDNSTLLIATHVIDLVTIEKHIFKCLLSYWLSHHNVDILHGCVFPKASSVLLKSTSSGDEFCMFYIK